MEGTADGEGAIEGETVVTGGGKDGVVRGLLVAAGDVDSAGPGINNGKGTGEGSVLIQDIKDRKIKISAMPILPVLKTNFIEFARPHPDKFAYALFLETS